MSETVRKFPSCPHFQFKGDHVKRRPWGGGVQVRFQAGPRQIPAASAPRAGAAGNSTAISCALLICQKAARGLVKWTCGRWGRWGVRGELLGSCEILLGDRSRSWHYLHPHVAESLKRVWWARSALCWSKFTIADLAREVDFEAFKNWM